MKSFNRSDYYSQTEASRLLKLSVKRFKTLVSENDIKHIERPFDAGRYQLQALYFSRKDIEELKKKLG